MKRQRLTMPVVFAAVLFMFVLVAGTLRVYGSGSGRQAATAGIAVLLYLAWVVLEFCLVSLRELSVPASSGDRGSFEMYALAQGVTVVAAILLPGAWDSPVTSILGLALLAWGCGLRLGAIVELGRFYSRRVRLVENHRVVTTGPYRLVRHPAYLGTLIGHLGLVLVFGHWLPLLVWAALFVPMVVRRILVEEPLLLQVEGYAAYAAGRKRLVPGVW